LPSSLCFLLSPDVWGIIVMLRCPVSPRSSLSSLLLYPTLPYSLIVSRARRQ
jgi:hypothetical protein